MEARKREMKFKKCLRMSGRYAPCPVESLFDVKHDVESTVHHHGHQQILVDCSTRLQCPGTLGSPTVPEAREQALSRELGDGE